jgi:hypothetical protein
MAPPWGVLSTVDGGTPRGALPVGPAVATTEVEEDVDGGPLGGRCRWVRQRPPSSLKRTPMAGPMGGAANGSGSGHHRG